MKIILSRKGFDSGNGGMPSPILPDGTMLSMPIISPEEELTFEDLQYDDTTYADILTQLQPKEEWKKKRCHLDPDIRSGVRIASLQNWEPLFGQVGSSETHLQNNGVAEGDLFLFFGWFKQTEGDISNGTLKFVKNAPDVQVIYGYMQIEKRLCGNEITQDWHSHYLPYHNSPGNNNTIYTSANRLMLDGTDYGEGFGAFSYNEKYRLTKKGAKNRSEWDLLDWMKNGTRITYHSKDSIKDNYFQSVKRGQEFVIDANKDVLVWVKSFF